MFQFILIFLGILSPNENPPQMSTQSIISIQNNLHQEESFIDGNGHGNGGNTGSNTGQLPPPQ